MIDDSQNFRLINDAFPHLGKKLRFLWGEPEFYQLVDSLQMVEEGKTKEGFPPGVLAALFSLSAEHDSRFPELVPAKKDTWSIYADRR